MHLINAFYFYTLTEILQLNAQFHTKAFKFSSTQFYERACKKRCILLTHLKTLCSEHRFFFIAPVVHEC